MSRDTRQEWETPSELFDPLDKEFEFQLDAAALPHNTKCEHYITPEMDALSDDQVWVGRWIEDRQQVSRVWLNPGFAKMKPWAKKAYEQAQEMPGAVVVVPALISPSTEWWENFAMKASEIRLLGGDRPQYVPAPGIDASTNSREGCVIIFRRNVLNTPPRIWTWYWKRAISDN